MTDLLPIFNIPILQAFLLVLVIGVAERMGIPIIAGLKNLMNIQPPDSGIDRLTSYYNHDLTDKLDRILTAEEKEHDANQATREVLVDIRNSLANIEKYGVNCRHDGRGGVLP